MKIAQRQPCTRRTAVAFAAVALAAVALPAQSRNVRLMESVPDTVRVTRVRDILGNLEMRFGGDTGRGANVVRRDVIVKGVGTTKLDDVGEDDRVLWDADVGRRTGSAAQLRNGAAIAPKDEHQ